MTKNGEELHIDRCLTLIEEKLGWGKSENWVNYDFEKLSDAIHERTAVQLSVTTLKRIWGKLKYDSAPTLTTLNTLAQFAGYNDWRSFRQEDSRTKVEEAAVLEANAKEAPMPVQRKWAYYWIGLLITALLLIYVFIPFRKQTAASPKVDAGLFSFRADKMKTEGVPNSVVFHYDAHAARTDSVFIVQTWDIRRKKIVPRDKTAHSAIYYYPGFFRTRLIADGVTVRTHDLWITSDGWLCLAENEPVPLYFKKEEFTRKGITEVDENLIAKYNLSLHPKPPRLRFYNQRDLGDLMSDNFVFETTLKNAFDKGANACQMVEVLIQCKNDFISIPLSARACVGDLDIAFCGYSTSSKEADLSRFGSDLTRWTTLRVEVINKKATIYVNNEVAHVLSFPNPGTGVVGVQYRFHGVGAVKDTWIEGNGKRIIF